jgi:hypothetical protein
LISCFLLTKKNNELFIKNHEIRSIGYTTFAEVNAIRPHIFCPRRGRGRGRRQGPDRNIYYNRSGKNKVTKNNDNHQKWAKN